MSTCFKLKPIESMMLVLLLNGKQIEQGQLPTLDQKSVSKPPIMQTAVELEFANKLLNKKPKENTLLKIEIMKLKTKCCNVLQNSEELAHKIHDYYGTQKFNLVARKLDFLNRFPILLFSD